MAPQKSYFSRSQPTSKNLLLNQKPLAGQALHRAALIWSPEEVLCVAPGLLGKLILHLNFLPGSLTIMVSPAQQSLPGGQKVPSLVWWGQDWQQALQGKVHPLKAGTPASLPRGGQLEELPARCRELLRERGQQGRSEDRTAVGEPSLPLLACRSQG